MRTGLFVCFLFTLFVTQPAFAQIETLAKEAIIVDANSGAVLLDKQAGDRMPTSSMSKLMTMYMVFEALKNGQLKLSDELMYHLDNFDQNQAYIGLEFRIKKECSIELGYLKMNQKRSNNAGFLDRDNLRLTLSKDFDLR